MRMGKAVSAQSHPAADVNVDVDVDVEPSRSAGSGPLVVRHGLAEQPTRVCGPCGRGRHHPGRRCLTCPGEGRRSRRRGRKADGSPVSAIPRESVCRARTVLQWMERPPVASMISAALPRRADPNGRSRRRTSPHAVPTPRTSPHQGVTLLRRLLRCSAECDGHDSQPHPAPFYGTTTTASVPMNSLAGVRSRGSQS
jgi:hypothetical protein